jgi:S-formylglutathione hydrolase
MDVGVKDQIIGSTVATLDKVLTNYGIKHEYETYDGNHTDHIAERLEKKVLPFFGENLKQ